MSTNLRNVALVWAIPILLGVALATGLAWPRATQSPAAVGKPAAGAVQKWAKVSVELPTNPALFPSGDGADIANGQCQLCHSVEMVLLQPALTQDEWATEINKMRTAFGAPLPAAQVDALARYLHSINGRESRGGPSVADDKAS